MEGSEPPLPEPFLPEPWRVVREEPEPTLAGAAPRIPRPHLWWEILAILCIAVLPDVWNAIASFSGVSEPNSVRDSVSLLVRSVLVSYAVLFVCRVVGVSRERLGLTRPAWPDLGTAAALLLLSLGAFLALDPFLRNLTPGTESRVLIEPRTHFELALLSIALVANAFAEELVIRGYLIARLEEATASSGIAVLVSATAFASYHVYQGLPATIHLFAFGLIHGLCFVLVRRLWPLVLSHAIWGLCVACFWPES